MRARTILPYLAALLLLAWILGTLSRTGSGQPGILANSYWLVYLVYLLPLFAVGVMFVITIYLAWNWKLLSDFLGVGIAQKRRQSRKQSQAIRLAVWIGFWTIAIGTLLWRCGGIFCSSANNTQTLPNLVMNAVDNSPSPALPSLGSITGPVYAIAEFTASPYFTLIFLGLLIISTVIVARAFKVSLDETRAGRFLPAHVREEGTMAVQDALRVLEMEEIPDPRARIMACYERMIRAAAGLGAHVSVDQTARELERGIRQTFRLRGRGISELTGLFEEARYSLHDMTGDDSDLAQECLREIGEELRAAVTVEN